MTELRDRLVSRALGDADELQRWAADRADRARRAIAAPGGEPETIRAVQRALRLFRGVFRGRPTGRFDDATRAALVRYQERYLPGWAGSTDPNLADGPSAPLQGFLDWRTLYVLDYQAHDLEEAALSATPPTTTRRSDRNVFRIERHAENELDVVVDRWHDLDRRIYLQLQEVDVLDDSEDLGRIDATIVRRADGACRFVDDLEYHGPAGTPAAETGDGLVVRLQVEGGEWRSFAIPLRGERAAADDGETRGRDRYEVSFAFKEGREGRLLAPSAPAADGRAVAESPWVVHVRPGRPAVPAELEAAFERVRTRMQRIRLLADSVDRLLRTLRACAAERVQQVGLLNALDGMLGALLADPKEPPPADDRAAAASLRERLRTLIDHANQHMILRPPHLAGLVDDTAAQARELRGILGEEALCRDVELLVEHRAAAPAALWTDTTEALRRAALALLGTDESQRFLDEHAVPMLQAIASRTAPIEGLELPADPDLAAAIRDAPAAPSGTSVLLAIAQGAGLATMAVGNVPGPSTLVVALLQAIGPALIGEDAVFRRLAFGWGFRALVWAAGWTRSQAGAVCRAVDADELVSFGEAAPARMGTPGWGAALGAANILVFVAAVTSDDQNTLRRWANILASGTGVALSASVALRNYSALIAAHVVEGLGGQVLGVVGGLASIASSTATAIEADEVHDDYGVAIAVTSGVGGALSVAGFLCAAGLATSTTVAGAPVGACLMAAGAALGLGAGVVSFVRGLTIPGTRLLFEGFMDAFRGSGSYLLVAERVPALRAALEAVLEEEHADLWYVALARTPQLLDLGFSGEHVAVIVDEELSAVQARADGRRTS